MRLMGIRRDLGVLAASTVIVEAIVLGFDRLRAKLNERDEKKRRRRRKKETRRERR